LALLCGGSSGGHLRINNALDKDSSITSKKTSKLSKNMLQQLPLLHQQLCWSLGIIRRSVFLGSYGGKQLKWFRYIHWAVGFMNDYWISGIIFSVVRTPHSNTAIHEAINISWHFEQGKRLLDLSSIGDFLHMWRDHRGCLNLSQPMGCSTSTASQRIQTSPNTSGVHFFLLFCPHWCKLFTYKFPKHSNNLLPPPNKHTSP
jgi:hypothetical protein